jgi:hypothetical protein
MLNFQKLKNIYRELTLDFYKLIIQT